MYFQVALHRILHYSTSIERYISIIDLVMSLNKKNLEEKDCLLTNETNESN